VELIWYKHNKQTKRSSTVRPRSQEHLRGLLSLPLSSLSCLLSYTYSPLVWSRWLYWPCRWGGELGDPASSCRLLAAFLLLSVHCHPDFRRTAAAAQCSAVIASTVSFALPWTFVAPASNRKATPGPGLFPTCALPPCAAALALGISHP
jgi:hypothetical protein